MNRWLGLTGGTAGPAYVERFRRMADRGVDVHGEARLLDDLLRHDFLRHDSLRHDPLRHDPLRHDLGRAGRVLDAGCGTGRVGIELARRGHDVVGVDLDDSMLAEARRLSAEAGVRVRWIGGDLVDLPRILGAERFDLVAAPGNVMVFLTPGTEADVVAALASALSPGGLLVAGFDHDRHVSRADYASWCERAGLVHVQSLAGWDGAPDDGGPYAVHVHRRPREHR